MDDLLYISRDFGAATLLIATVASPFLSLVDTTREVEYNLSPLFAVHACFLILSYVVGSVGLLVESIRSRGELPDATASLSNTLFICIIVIRLESLPTKLKTLGWYLNCAFWAVLQFIELSTAGWIALRPSLPSPYFQVGFALSIYRALTCSILLTLFLRSYHRGYRSLAQSDLENTDPPEADTEDVDKDNEGGDTGRGITTADYLGLRREAFQEIEDLGGWLPYVKRFRIFLQYTWPFGRRLLQIRFVMTFILLVLQRFIDVQVPLRSAALIDAISSKRNPWRPFAIFFFLRFVNSNMCLSILEDLTWIDVDLCRQKMLMKGAHFKILNLDSYFHTFVQPTDIIKAVDTASSIDKLLDSIIFHLLPNAFTLVFAIYNIYHRFGPFMIIIVMYMVTAYAFSEKRSLAAMIKEYGSYVTARDSHERRRQGGVHGWQTVSVHNQVEHECDMYDAEVDSYTGQLRAYYIVLYFFRFIHSLIFQTSHIIGYALVIHMVYSGRCTIGDLTAFLGLWGLLWGPVDYLTTVVGFMLEEFLDADRLRRIMEQKARVSYGILSLEYDKGEVRLERISFTYPGSKKLNIDEVSLTIKGGTKVAFVGPSGTGKSTIFKLLMRQLLPTQGAIYIDGQDISTLTRDSYVD
jgi:ABC-type multidrug transport system fused ATPase/permease subunit